LGKKTSLGKRSTSKKKKKKPWRASVKKEIYQEKHYKNATKGVRKREFSEKGAGRKWSTRCTMKNSGESDANTGTEKEISQKTGEKKKG